MKTILFHTVGSTPTAGEIAKIAALNALAAQPYKVLVRSGRAKAQITATTISAATADHSLNDSGDGFLAAGFVPGMVVSVIGGASTTNVKNKTIATVTAGKMKFTGTSGDTIVTAAAGASITIASVEAAKFGDVREPADYLAGTTPPSYYDADGLPCYDVFNEATPPNPPTLPANQAVVSDDQEINVTGGGTVQLTIEDGVITGCAYTAPG